MGSLLSRVLSPCTTHVQVVSVGGVSKIPTISKGRCLSALRGLLGCWDCRAHLQFTHSVTNNFHFFGSAQKGIDSCWGKNRSKQHNIRARFVQSLPERMFWTWFRVVMFQLASFLASTQHHLDLNKTTALRGPPQSSLMRRLMVILVNFRVRSEQLHPTAVCVVEGGITYFFRVKVPHLLLF